MRQNRSKNKLVRENAVTPAHGSCSLRVMGSWYGYFFFAERKKCYAILYCSTKTIQPYLQVFSVAFFFSGDYTRTIDVIFEYRKFGQHLLFFYILVHLKVT